jgi:hypothetical protein
MGANRAGAGVVSETSELLVRRAYEAFNACDIENALAPMHPDVDWPNGMEGGCLHDHRGVSDYWCSKSAATDDSGHKRRLCRGCG